jgi:hypothetical protein
MSIPLSQGSALSVPKENEVTQAIEEMNKAFVPEAFETLFNKRDYAAPERLR